MGGAKEYGGIKEQQGQLIQLLSVNQSTAFSQTKYTFVGIKAYLCHWRSAVSKALRIVLATDEDSPHGPRE